MILLYIFAPTFKKVFRRTDAGLHLTDAGVRWVVFVHFERQRAPTSTAAISFFEFARFTPLNGKSKIQPKRVLSIGNLRIWITNDNMYVASYGIEQVLPQ